MSRHRTRFTFLRSLGVDRAGWISLIGLAQVVMLSGCGLGRGYSGTGGGGADPAGMILSQSGPEDFAPPGTPAAISDLSRQASSDVDWLLSNNAGARDSIPVDNQPSGGNRVEERMPAQPRPKQLVIWNDTPPSVKTAPKHALAKADGEDSPEKMKVSSLFQPEDNSIEVKDLPKSKAKSGGQNLKTDRRRQLMVDLTRELFTESTWSDMPLRNLLAIASLSMVDPERRLDPEALPDLSERERELFGVLQEFFAELGEGLDGSKEAETVITTAVTNLKLAIQNEPPLTLRTLALCSRVGSFGDYDEITRRSFLALAEESFGLYLEVDNFTSTQHEKGQWVTELSLALTIYRDDDGTPVWRQNWTPTVDRSKNRRQDFFIAQKVMLPKALGTGKYQLKVRLRDDKNGAITEDAVEFIMVADPKMAREG